MLKSIINKLSQNKYLPILSILILTFLWLVYRLTIAINQTPELLNGETNNIWNALKVLSGKPIYTNPEAIPYEIFQYTPFSQLPIIFLVWFENIFFPSQDFIFTLGAGRILSIVYNLLTAIFIFKILKNQLKVEYFFALFGSLTFLCLLPHHFFAVRPDSMALLFAVTGIYFFTKAYFQEHQTSFIVSAVILAFSFFVKQDAFLISGAFGLILLLTKKFKGLISFSISLIVSLGILLLIAPLFFGPYFYKSIFGGIALSMKFEQFSYILLRYMTFYYLLVLLLVISIFYIVKTKIDRKIFFYLITLLLFCLSITAFTTLKEGSHINYYELPTLISILIVFFSLSQATLNNHKIKLASIVLTPFLCLHFLFFQFYHYTSFYTKFKESRTEHQAFLTENSTILYYLKKSKSNIISFDQNVKLLNSENVILPNSEFYGVSKYSYTTFSNENPKHKAQFIILPTNMELPFEYLDLFKIKGQEYITIYKSNQIKIYKHEH
jgi:hypothetical protein